MTFNNFNNYRQVKYNLTFSFFLQVKTGNVENFNIII